MEKADRGRLPSIQQATLGKGVQSIPSVSEVMVSDVVTIDSSASIVDAARQVVQEKKGPLPVMEGGELRAMITDRDIIAHVALRPAGIFRIEIGSAKEERCPTSRSRSCPTA